MKSIIRLPQLLILAVFFFSCEGKIEDPAKELLLKARQEYDAGNYSNSRLLIDSLSVAYPKAYKTRREAEILRREAMIREKERDLVFFNAEVVRLQEQVAVATQEFTLNKDSRYQDKGYFTLPSQALSKNAGNCFLRASVNEDGTAYIASFYRGKKIGYNTVKVTAGGSYVQCSRPFTSKSYRSYGVQNERCDYKHGEDGGIMDFIAMSDGPFKVELSGGDGTFSYTLRSEDAVAVKKAVELSRLLCALEETLLLRDDAQVSLDILLKGKEISEADAAGQHM